MTSKRTQIMERIASAMTRLENIRNISVVAHVDHGKSTLTDALIAKAGLMSKDRAGTARFMDSRPDEQERTITIKSSSVSMVFDVATPVKNKPVDPEWQRKKAADKAADKAKGNAAAAAAAADVAAKQPEQQPVPAPAPASTQALAPAPAPAPAVIASNDQKKDDAATATANGAKKVPAGYATDSYLINLIDSPGHVDFSSEVTAALRLSDGALVVVDAIESVCVQTKTVLRQALQERVRPVLFLNKLDRAFLELNQPLEELYQSLARTVESTNVIIHTYADELLGDVTVWPQNGSVGFGSGLHGWGFTLQSFARIYHDKFGISEKKMMKKLWGDNFYDAARKKWSTEQFVTDTNAADGTVTTRKLERGFCMLVLEPLRRLTRAIMAEKPDVAAYTAMIRKLSLQTPLTNNDLTGLTGKDLLKRVLQAWLPAADALTSLIVQHLPSPATAQRYRVNNLYSGPLDDECAAAIRTCDPEGPLMIAVTKMIPTADASRFFAFGRVFSGTLRVGATVRIQGPDYLADVTVGGPSSSSSSSGSGDAKTSSSSKSKNDLYVKPLTGAVLHMGPLTESMSVMPCGMMVGLIGVDQFLLKTGTVTSHPNAHNFNALKFSVSPIVRCAVTVADAANMPKLVVGLKRMVKADPLVTVTMSANGEHIVGCCGELHMEICLKDLRDDFMKGVALKVSDPVVSFCETVKPSETPNKECIAKSLNKHNRLHVTAEALGEPFCRAVDAGELGVGGDAKAMAHRLREDFAWDLTEAKKIWSFGQSDGIANVLVDRTKAVPYLPDARDVIVAAFREQTNIGGVYTGEPLRGVRFNVTDAKLHAEAVHRGPRQLNAVVVDAMKGALIAATPALMEPVYQCDIAVPQSASAGVYATLRARRATIVELDDGKASGSDAKAVGDMVRISAYLPVTESFGFGQLLRKNTSGQAFPQMLFSHWAVMPGSCSDASTLAGQTVAALRERKGMKPVLPKFDDFNVKL